jgi:hypothetical protein
MSNIVADFTQRVIDDPRVNWTRQAVTHAGISFLHKGKSETWNPTPENVEQLKKHMVEKHASANCDQALISGEYAVERSSGVNGGN